MTRRTILKGPFVMGQDITKSDVETTILFDTFGPDGTEITDNGVESAWVLNRFQADEGVKIIAATREGRRVISNAGIEGGYWQLVLCGDSAPRSFNPAIENIELEVTAYMDGGYIEFGIIGPDYNSIVHSVLVHSAPNDMLHGIYSIMHSPGPKLTITEISNDPGYPAGWYKSKLLIEAGLVNFKTKIWLENDEEPDYLLTAPNSMVVSMPWHVMAYGTREVSDLYSISYRTWR